MLHFFSSTRFEGECISTFEIFQVWGMINAPSGQDVTVKVELHDLECDTLEAEHTGLLIKVCRLIIECEIICLWRVWVVNLVDCCKLPLQIKSDFSKVEFTKIWAQPAFDPQQILPNWIQLFFQKLGSELQPQF